MDDRLSRRQVLGGLTALALAGCSAPTDGDPTTTGSGGPTTTPEVTVEATEIASGFASPVGVEVPRSGRHYVVDQRGVITRHEDGATTTFLDIRERLVDLSGYEERGLLGLAFHPGFADNGRFYVRYSAPPRAGTPSGYDHTFVLAEFTAEPGADRANPASERTVLEIPEPQSNHNGGAIAFGPDGYLYVAVGDGGGANDRGRGHVADWYPQLEGGNGQDVTSNLLGSILRIDVDDRDGDRGYGIPEDNPLVDREGLPEHYAWGLRNPWRMSFGPDGRLLVADVGQNRWEEVDVVEAGGNYGWNVYEGTHCFGRSSCPSVTPDGQRLRPPVIEYPHSGRPVSGVAVVGGYVYEGDTLPALAGQYVFADWQARGRLFVARQRDSGLWPTRVVPIATDAVGPNVLAFGREPDGELLICTSERGDVSGSTGAVFRLG